MKRKWKEPLWALAFLLSAALLLGYAAAVVRPAHTDYGSTWEAYRAEPEDSIDVLFLGSSYAYCDWNPAAMYAASGLTGYVMGGSEQTPTITEYYLQEALKTQSPSVVVMEGTGLLFDRYQNFTQINLVYMPWGLPRLRAILECAEPDKRLGLFFELYFYHDRWKEVGSEELVRPLQPARTDHLKGHTAIATVYEGEGPFPRPLDQDPAVYEEHLAALGRIARLCGEKGIDLIVTINPTYSQCSGEMYAQLARDVAQAAPEALFVNWADSFEELGLDGSRHLSDGWHLNREGAILFSAATGRFLLEQGYTPRSQTPENEAAWQAAADAWEN